MRLIFMGTPDFAVPSLKALYETGHEILGVYTQPDRPAGRGKKMKASPVKEFAESLNLPVFQPEKIKAPESVRQLAEFKPECIVVVAFGQILSREILDIPFYGCINVHASLLPSYRGAAPIHWAVINGETKTGVTTMLMDEGLDTGDILLKEEYNISPDATAGEVHDDLAKLGAKVLLSTLKGLKEGSLKPVPQPEEFSYAPPLKREHERLVWQDSAEALHNRIRGLNPWPGAFTYFRGKLVKVWRSRIPDKTETEKYLEESEHALAGQILGCSEKGIVCQAGKGIIELTELQPANRKQMKALDFFNGSRCRPGEVFGEGNI